MKLAHVGRFMPEGVRAFSNLLNILFEVALACKVAVKKHAEWNCFGLTLEGGKYLVGIYLSEPEKLWFGTRCRINCEAATKLGVGELTEESWVPDRYRWWRGVELDSEPIHFFSRTKVGQMQWLEGFLRECLARARLIETPDQPPIPEESEEGS